MQINRTAAQLQVAQAKQVFPVLEKQHALASVSPRSITAPSESTTSAFEPCVGFVRAFLQGLWPSMADLTPKFISAGLVNEACLIALAEMPADEKEGFLRDEMPLSRFQLRVVCIGLAGLI